MDSKTEELIDRLEKSWKTIRQLAPGSNKIQLKRMYYTASELYNQCSMEEVECRRTRHVTVKYTELQKKLELAVANLEQYVVLAVLLDD